LLQIIMYLVNKIKWQNELIEKLSDYIDWLEDDTNRPKKGTDITQLDYNKLTLDDPPKVVAVERLDYKELLKQAEQQGKPIKPIKYRKNSTPVPASIRCAKCNAPHSYLYKNNGDQNQLKCKVCSAVYSEKNK